DLLDAGVGLEPEALHMLAVADGADHRDLLAARGVRTRAHALDAGDDGLDVLLAGHRLHDDHHSGVLLKRTWTERSDEGELRRSALGPEMRTAYDTPTEHLAKSPGGIRVGVAVRPEAGDGGDSGRGAHRERRSLQQGAQRLNEALVLGLGADGDPQRAL